VRDGKYIRFADMAYSARRLAVNEGYSAGFGYQPRGDTAE
jgi:hypothetical protein